MKTNPNIQTGGNEVNGDKNLRSLLFTSLAALCLCASVVNSRAQIFTAGVGVTGTSNALVQVAFQPITNTAYSSLIQRTLQIQNINTNETITVGYGCVFSGNGLTNIQILATNQYSFPSSAGWTNGATFTTNIPAQSYYINVSPVGQISISGSYSNNILFQ